MIGGFRSPLFSLDADRSHVRCGTDWLLCEIILVSCLPGNIVQTVRGNINISLEPC